MPCECGKVYIGETGRSFNTRIKEHKACQRLGDGDNSAIMKHAQQQQHKINWEDSSLITSIPHWHTRRVREAIEILQHNTVPQDSGFTHQRHLAPSPAENTSIASPRSTTSSTSSRFTHICNQHTSHPHSSHPVISPEDGQHRLTEISRHFLNLNSSFQNYHMVLPQAPPHYQSYACIRKIQTVLIDHF